MYEESYDALILSPGAKPVRPPIPGIDNERIMTLRNVPDADMLRQWADQYEGKGHAAVIGGGFIGVEMAENLHQRGMNVTLIEGAPYILAPFDTDMVNIAEREIVQHKVQLILGNGVQSFESLPSQVRVHLANGTKIDADFVVLSIGVRPDTAFLKQSGIALTERGYIMVNEKMQTSHPKIYAAGDITGFSMLAHTASREAEVAVNHIVGIKDKMNYAAVPAVVYTNPEIAGVGPTEESLQAKGIKYSVSKLPMTFSGRFVAENDGGTGLCKLLFDEQKQLLGAHIIGNPASELITIAALAIETHLTVEQFKKLVFPHPSVGEIFKETLFEDF